jgi:hypothetical protein
LRDWAKLTATFESVEAAAYGYFSDWTAQECERVHVALDHAACTATLR